MKRYFILALSAFAFGTILNAQTVINNNFDENPSTSLKTQTDYKEKDEMISSANFVFYTFKGINNFGLSNYWINPNGIGGDFNIRANFKEHGNFSFDLSINYAFKLWQQEKNKLMFVVAVGPSIRIQDALKNIDYNVNKTTGKVTTKEEYKSKVFCDLFINPRFAFKAGHFNLSAGYFLWSAKWKFSNGAVLHGFNASVGYSF